MPQSRPNLQRRNDILTSIIPLPYRLIFIGVIFAAAGAFGWFKGCEHVQANWDKEKQAQAVLVAQQQFKNEQTVIRQQKLSDDIQKDYGNRLVQLQETIDAKTSPISRIACGVREPSSNSIGLPASSKTAGGIAENSSNGLAARLPQDCAATTIQLEELQRWAEGIGK